jgi:hypothetical protein
VQPRRAEPSGRANLAAVLRAIVIDEWAPVNVVAPASPVMSPVWNAGELATTDSPRTGLVRRPYRRGSKMNGPRNLALGGHARRRERRGDLRVAARRWQWLLIALRRGRAAHAKPESTHRLHNRPTAFGEQSIRDAVTAASAFIESRVGHALPSGFYRAVRGRTGPQALSPDV